jgi:hypothetical protein
MPNCMRICIRWLSCGPDICVSAVGIMDLKIGTKPELPSDLKIMIMMIVFRPVSWLWLLNRVELSHNSFNRRSEIKNN